MKERPIIFSGPMVKAILEGRKTQTRRVVRPQPHKGVMAFSPAISGAHWIPQEQVGYDFGPNNPATQLTTMNGSPIKSPYGVPGDRLWVRETFALYQTIDFVKRPDGRSFSEVSDGLAAYRADGYTSIDDLKEHLLLMDDGNLEAVAVDNNKWKPSIHMPRWASRILLEVVEVRVERVQEITGEDCLMEGIQPYTGIDFCTLWNSVNARRGFGWDTNPWVWVVTFKRIEG